jgi:hypothetical protein
MIVTINHLLIFHDIIHVNYPCKLFVPLLFVFTYLVIQPNR